MSKIKVITFMHKETEEERNQNISKVTMEVMEIENTLEEKQKIVGGLIDFLTIAQNRRTGRTIDFVCNDEGLLEQLPLTLRYTFTKDFYQVEEDDVEYLVGNLILLAVDKEGDTVSLTDEEIEFYTDYFSKNTNLIMNPPKMFTSDI